MPAPSQTTTDANLGQNTVQTVFNRAALQAYRAANVFRAIADVKWSENDPPMPGNPVTFTIINALAPATTPLSEATEPNPVAIGNTTASITLAEYGNAVKRTKKVKLTSFLNLDTEDAREVAANMEESMDIVARDVLVAGTNVLYGGTATSRATVAATHNFTGNNARRARAYLAGKNTPGVDGRLGYGFVGFIHPDVSYDFQAETGTQAWQGPHVYGGDTANIYNGEIGTFAGIRWVENANSKIFANAGVGGTVDVYAVLICGQQALGDAVGEAQHVVISGPFDDLQRFVSIGWYALEGFGIIRQNSLVRYEVASSIGAN